MRPEKTIASVRCRLRKKCNLNPDFGESAFCGNEKKKGWAHPFILLGSVQNPAFIPMPASFWRLNKAHQAVCAVYYAYIIMVLHE